MAKKTVLPPVKHEGAMTAVAQRMGYERPTEVPDARIPEYVDRLVNAYGERAARGMVQRQLVYRKGDSDAAEGKFRRMKKALNADYKGGGWTPPRTRQKPLRQHQLDKAGGR